MLFVWSLSFVICIATLTIGLLKRSSILLLLSTVTSLPIALYFIGANNGFQLLGFIPLLIGASAFYIMKRTLKII